MKDLKIPLPSSLFSTATLVILVGTAGCDPAMDTDCQTSEGCPESTFCRMGECTPLEDPTYGGRLGIDGNAGPDALVDTGDAGPSHPCPAADEPSPERVVMTEFMANVPAGEAGDANRDGTRHYHDDEFVELVNTGDETVDMEGVAILDGDDVRFTFETYCLQPGHALVVFGGLETGAQPPEGDDWESMISETWFRFAQNEGRVVVRTPTGDDIADVSYGSHPEGSLTLHEDLEGDEYIPHAESADDESLFSPGTCPDGQPFTTGCEPDEYAGDLKP